MSLKGDTHSIKNTQQRKCVRLYLEEITNNKNKYTLKGFYPCSVQYRYIWVCTQMKENQKQNKNKIKNRSSNMVCFAG